MYKVISANRSSKREPKNWRIFEKEAVEKHFGEVIDCDGEDGCSVLETYKKHKDSVEYIRWYPDPELMNKSEYDGMVDQSDEIGDVPYLVNSAHGFKSVQCKDAAFGSWRKNNVSCPDFFVFETYEDFKERLEASSFTYPVLIRVNDSVAGNHTKLIESEKSFEESRVEILKYKDHSSGIDTKLMCVEFLDTIDKELDVNVSFRIHATSRDVISGYARVVSSKDWLAITAGKFNIKDIDKWIYYNRVCEKICKDYKEEICKSISSLGLNMQGVDVVIDQKKEKISFLEVQPTYASGYPMIGYCGYYPPFFNPSEPSLVNFLLQNKSALEKEIPMYYNNWLDKNNHFDLMYKSLKNVWSQ
jgi:hypothetical protein